MPSLSKGNAEISEGTLAKAPVLGGDSRLRCYWRWARVILPNALTPSRKEFPCNTRDLEPPA